MTRRIVWLAVALLALLVIGGIWFVDNFEQVPVKERSDPEPEARRNPYLALERFTARLGRPLARESNALFLDALPAGGVLLLDRNRRHFMGAARVDRLLAWVEGGGYLLLVPEFSGTPDPVLERLDVRWTEFKLPKGAKEAKDEEARHRPWPQQLAVQVPGHERPLSIRFQGGLEAGKRQPAWTAGDEDYGDQVLHFAYGRGHVTVIAGLDRLLANGQIGERDQAELLWTLLQTYQPRGRLTLMSHLAVPNLWDWLVETGWAAGSAGAALLVLWLWRTLPRFGPAAPEPAPSRRELREHLAALGRYVWRAGGLGHWLAVAREDFQARLALRHPAIAALPAAEQAAALAKLSRRPQSLIAAALAGPAASPHGFTAALRTLKNLERQL